MTFEQWQWGHAIAYYRGRDLRPTGECFFHSLQFFGRFDFEPEALECFRLVHAIVMNPLVDEPQAIAHAWVEFDEVAYEPMLMNDSVVYAMMPRPTFYAALRVQEQLQYRVAEAWDWNARTNHFGPWEERFQAVCRAPACAKCGQLISWPIPLPASDFCAACREAKP